MKTQRQHGISLLEVLLVILIAAGIVSAAITYYSQTLRSSRASEAASFIQQVNKAGYEWLQIANAIGKYPGDFSDLANAPDENGLEYFVSSQLIPCENRSCFTNPWGGSNTVTPGSDPKYMLITLFGVPQADCALLQQHMQNIAPQGLPQQNSCENTGKNTASYYLSL